MGQENCNQPFTNITVILSVTDNELLAGELFGILFAIIGAIISFIFIFNIIKSRTTNDRLRTILYLIAGLGMTAVGIYFYDIEHHLRTESIYVNGITIGFCHRGENGRGVEFEYYVNGVRYTNCNNYKKVF